MKSIINKAFTSKSLNPTALFIALVLPMSASSLSYGKAHSGFSFETSPVHLTTHEQKLLKNIFGSVKAVTLITTNQKNAKHTNMLYQRVQNLKIIVMNSKLRLLKITLCAFIALPLNLLTVIRPTTDTTHHKVMLYYKSLLKTASLLQSKHG